MTEFVNIGRSGEPTSCDAPARADAGCDGCQHDRRGFLQEMLRLAATSLLALGAAPATASALRWHVVSALSAAGTERRYPLPQGDGVSIDEREGVMIARVGNRVFAFSLACPHQSTALRWRARDQRFECPKHRSKYQPDGTFISGRATRSLDRFAVRREHAELVVDVDTLLREDRDAARWTAAMITI